MLRPVIIVNGKVVGVWKHAKKKNRISISVELFRALADSEKQSITAAARRFGRFHETAVELE